MGIESRSRFREQETTSARERERSLALTANYKRLSCVCTALRVFEEEYERTRQPARSADSTASESSGESLAVRGDRSDGRGSQRELSGRSSLYQASVEFVAAARSPMGSGRLSKSSRAAPRFGPRLCRTPPTMVRPKFKDEHVFGQSALSSLRPFAPRHRPRSRLAPSAIRSAPRPGPTSTPSRLPISCATTIGASWTPTLTCYAATEKRKAEAERIRAKYSDRIPVSPSASLPSLAP